MDEFTHEKFVNFAYCGICKSKDVDERKEPCNSCVANPVNFESTKPVKYVEDPEKVKLNAELIREKHLHVSENN